MNPSELVRTEKIELHTVPNSIIFCSNPDSFAMFIAASAFLFARDFSRMILAFVFLGIHPFHVILIITD